MKITKKLVLLVTGCSDLSSAPGDFGASLHKETGELRLPQNVLNAVGFAKVKGGDTATAFLTAALDQPSNVAAALGWPHQDAFHAAKNLAEELARTKMVPASILKHPILAI